jgi:hypothetical protein
MGHVQAARSPDTTAGCKSLVSLLVQVGPVVARKCLVWRSYAACRTTPEVCPVTVVADSEAGTIRPKLATPTAGNILSPLP